MRKNSIDSSAAAFVITCAGNWVCYGDARQTSGVFGQSRHVKEAAGWIDDHLIAFDDAVRRHGLADWQRPNSPAGCVVERLAIGRKSDAAHVAIKLSKNNGRVCSQANSMREPGRRAETTSITRPTNQPSGLSDAGAFERSRGAADA